MLSSMRRSFYSRHFAASGLSHLVLALSLRFLKLKGCSKNSCARLRTKELHWPKQWRPVLSTAIVGNALLEDLIGQRLPDNARLIDQLLLSARGRSRRCLKGQRHEPPAKMIYSISRANGNLPHCRPSICRRQRTNENSPFSAPPNRR